MDAGPGFSSITGRDTLIATIGRFKSVGRELEVRFVDVEIAVNPDRSTAQATMTAEAHFSDEGGRGLEARELDVTFRRLDGDWVVSSVALVRTLTSRITLMKTIDLQFQGHRHVIATAVLEGPSGIALVDPGPSSTLHALESRIAGRGPSSRPTCVTSC